MDQELKDMLHFGKRYKTDQIDFSAADRDSYLKRAAKWYALADSSDRKKRLMWWWVEGVRDYCEDNAEVFKMEQLLKIEAVKFLKESDI